MTGQVRVRVARPDDARALAEVQVRSWQAAYVGLLPQDTLDHLSVERRLSSWIDRVATPGDPATGDLTLVGELDGRIVGELVCGPASADPVAGGPPPSPDDFGSGRVPSGVPGLGEIHLLYVLAEAWGEGVGHALDAEARVRLAGAGFDEVCLWVLEGNDRAIAAYERYGYRPTGQRRHDPVFDVYDLEYRLRLDA